MRTAAGPAPPPHQRLPLGARALIGLLLLALVLAAALAYEAERAARARRELAARMLRDYASVSAWQFARRSEEGLRVALEAVFRPDPAGEGGRRALPRLADLLAAASRAERCGCAPASRVNYFFTLDFARDSLATSCDRVPSAIRAWLRDTLVAHSRAAYRRDREFAVLVRRAGGTPGAVAYTVAYDATGRPLGAYGFEAALPAFGEPVFRRIVDGGPLLPAPAVGGRPNGSLFTVAVVDDRGQPLFGAPEGVRSGLAAAEPLDPAYGALRAHVALRAAAGGQLAGDRAARSHVPVLLALLAAAGALIAVTLFELRGAYELARLRSSFVSNVTHELRTPLAQIRLFAETLRMERAGSPAARRRSIAIIDREALRLSHLVESLLAFSRSEQHSTHVVPERCDVSSLVREILCDFAPLARDRQATIRAAIQPRVLAPVDRSAFRQILLNLLDNAARYGPAGQRIRVRLRRGRSRIRLEVADGGPGVPVADRGRIFEPYVRLEHAPAPGGTGVGLAVVRDLVRAHSGRVWVDDAPGGGARFVVELPAPGPGRAAGPSSPVPCPRPQKPR